MKRMEIIYCIFFWIVFIITIFLIIYCFNKGNLNAMKDFSLPLLGLIFTIGQLWQNQTNLRFEEVKYLQSRKDLYFDKKIEIALSLNSYIDKMFNEISKPFFNKELEFEHQKFFSIKTNFYKEVIEKARFLFDENYIQELNKIVDLTNNIQGEIQIMQNHLYLSEKHKDSDNFKKAQQNYSQLLSELSSKVDDLCAQTVSQLNIKEQVKL